MIKNRLLRTMIVAGLSAGMLTSVSADLPPDDQYKEPNMPAIVGYTFSDLPSDHGFPLIRSDWYKNPTAYSLSLIHI